MEVDIWLRVGWMLGVKGKFHKGNNMKQSMAEPRDLSYSSGNC